MLTRFSFMYIVITSAPCVSSDPNFQRRQLATGNWLIAKFVNCYLGVYWEQNELANRNTQAIPISASDSIVLIAIKSWKRLKKKNTKNKQILMDWASHLLTQESRATSRGVSLVNIVHKTSSGRTRRSPRASARRSLTTASAVPDCELPLSLPKTESIWNNADLRSNTEFRF